MTGPLFIAAVLAALGAVNTSAAQPACLQMELPRRVEAVPFYSDQKGSVIDPKRRELDNALMQGIRDARDHVGKLIDEALRTHVSDKSACAAANFASWARTAALTDPPLNLEARYERPLFTLSFALMLLKAENIFPRQDWPAINGWLILLAKEDVRAYRENTKIRNNIYYWVGAMAAAAALLHEDRELTDFADTVWNDALREADADGSLPQEMARGRRALTYQLYATDALLVLSRLREARQTKLTDEQKNRWARIVGFAESAVCEPTRLSARTGVEQEPIEPRALIPFKSFAHSLPNGPAPACIGDPRSHVDYRLGGNVDLLEAVLEAKEKIRGRP